MHASRPFGVVLTLGLLSACTANNRESVTVLDAQASAGDDGGGGGTGGTGGSPANGGSGGSPATGGSGGSPATGGTGGSGGSPAPVDAGAGGTPPDAGPPLPPDARVGPPGDRDDDGVLDGDDNCPAAANHPQTDGDADGVGDVCDVCPQLADPEQVDTDGDGRGDLCDLDDGDGDGVPDRDDVCPAVRDPGQADADLDGIGDACDNCPQAPNFSQLDGDGDGRGDACEVEGDDDGDGVPDGVDLCPRDVDPAQRDTDEDGRGDACDNCPQTPNFSQLDDDGDGLGNACDGVAPGPDAGPPPGLCEGVACPAGQACDPVSGRCLPVLPEGPVPGDPCAVDAECAAGDVCLADSGRAGRVPDGFCYRTCLANGDCTGDSVCRSDGRGGYCAPICEGDADCREGWLCRRGGDGAGTCVTDCRVAGCAAGTACNLDTVACVPTCRWPCAAGETCTDGHCVRANGSCDSDYHCPAETQSCVAGRCVTRELAVCTGNAGLCDFTQTCVPGVGDDYCLFACQTNANCGVSRTCQGGYCYYAFCGGADGNGAPFEACVGAGDPQWSGTCVPLDASSQASSGVAGVCYEGGTAPVGTPCNLDATTRALPDVGLRCVGGAYCYGDEDETLDPAPDRDTGICARACDPRAPGVCDAGTVCVDFSNPDDPRTLDRDETRPFGLCLVSDCTLNPGGADACGAGRACRPFGQYTLQGRCSPRGPVADGAPCFESADCQGSAWCVNAGAGRVCLPLCDADAGGGCEPGQLCTDVGSFGVCL
ncbi:thrombospondin type 3 repeat-containing protein [Myxococcota bacterium]|nr:thrombospondin type 3 repeat-containing protein [Myxococcota bacterium]